MTVLSIIAGILMIICGFCLIATPLITFMGTGYYIVILFFISGIVGIVRGIVKKDFGMEFIFAILSLLLGIAGLAIPGVALMNNFAILYMSAFWFVLRGILSIILAIRSRKLGAGSDVLVLGIILGALELIMGIYSFAHPAVLAIALGFLIGFYFIESGINMICLGSVLSRLQQFGKRIRSQNGSSENA
ncbi:MAG: DUF308 domain-containing protein [Oscillospiraceae bacterium]|nr:DUF308 domain-containing protein [Oscillospiraceae bacterium]